MIIRTWFWFVVPIIFILCIVIVWGLWLDESANQWVVMSLTFIVASIISIVFWYWINDKKNDKVLYDKATGEEHHLKKRHTLFFIPIQYIGILALLFSFFLLYNSIYWENKLWTEPVVEDTYIDWSNGFLINPTEE